LRQTTYYNADVFIRSGGIVKVVVLQVSNFSMTAQDISGTFHSATNH